MKIIVDRISIAATLLSAFALAWLLARGSLSSGEHSDWIRALSFCIISAMFARTAYGTHKAPFSREFSIVGFWLSSAALAINLLVLFGKGS